MFTLRPIARVRSPLTDVACAPKQGDEGAPDAWLDFAPEMAPGLRDLRPGDEVLVLTWLDQGNRDVLSVHPRGDASRPITGVFATRSPDRPNPIGLHAVRIEAVEEDAITVEGLEAIDNTPVLDIKPRLGRLHER